MKSINKLIIMLLFLVLLFSNTSYIYANNNLIHKEIVANNESKGVLFVTSGCLACKDALNFLSNKDIKVKIYNIEEDDNLGLMYKYNDFYKVEASKKGLVPILFTKNNYYSSNDIQKIEGELEFFNGIESFDSTDLVIGDKIKKDLKAVPAIAVMLAGFLDGFNPCAFSMLLFFISFVYSNKEKPIDILKAGLPFVLATFLAYLLIGLGLLNVAVAFKSTDNIIKGIYIFTIVLSLIIFVLNIRDYVSIKKGKMNIKNQLPKKVKHIIHSSIRKLSNKKTIMISSFLLGFLVSILEFFCTGQVYLPTITYVISLDNSDIYAKLLLILYNLSFILPLLITLFLIYKGTQVMSISMQFVNNLHYIKLLTGLFFLFVAIFVSKQLYIMV